MREECPRRLRKPSISADAIKDFDDPPSAFAGILDDTTWSFQTAADATPPTVVSNAPADDATGVAADTNLVKSIAVSDSSQVSIDGNVLTVTPNPLLDTESEYAIRIGAGAITDLYGNPFAGIIDDTMWNFTTGTAISLIVGEHSFEGAKALGGWTGGGPAAGQSVGNVPSPWVRTGTGFGSGWTSASQYSGGIPDGDIYAYANGPTNIRQTLAATMQADTTYTLTVGVGWRADLPGFGCPNFPGYGIELWAGNTKLTSTYSTNQGGTGASPTGGQWIDIVASYTSPASVTADALQIRLIGYGIQTSYDNVRLTAAPDTPSPGITTVTTTVTGVATSELFVRVQVTQD